MSPVARPRVDEWSVLPGSRISITRRLCVPRLFVASFLPLVALGTRVLVGHAGSYTGGPLRWPDASVRATSAVCVTGLVAVDTATCFTPTGQALLLLPLLRGGMAAVQLPGLYPAIRDSLGKHGIRAAAPDAP